MAQLKTSGPGVTHEREDLIDIITRIDPAEVPIYSNMTKGTAQAIRHDWTVQELVAVNPANAHPEGEEFSNLTSNMQVPARPDNFTQILLTPGEVSGTYDAVDIVGRARETSRQKVLKGLEQRRDTESIISNNSIKAGPTGTRNLAGLGTWITNVSLGGTGTAPTGDGTDATVPGTARAFDTAGYIDSVMESCYNEGGQPRIMYMRPALKPKFSALPDAWAPGTEHRVNATSPSEPIYVGAVDGYVSDFGRLDVAMSRFMHIESATSHVIYLVDPRYVKCCTLPGRNMFTEDLAKTGDNQKFQVVQEVTLQVTAPKAHGAIWALNPAL